MLMPLGCIAIRVDYRGAFFPGNQVVNRDPKVLLTRPPALTRYSGRAIWPSILNFPLTLGALVSGWPPPMLTV